MNMMKEEIISALVSWNFWKGKLDTGIDREIYLNTAKRYLNARKVLAITGVRRSGKSYLTKQIVDEYVKKIGGKNTLIVNFEEIKFDEDLNERFLLKLYEAYREILKPDSIPLIILDEIQEVKNWEKFVRSLDEKKEALFVITGSSSKLMSEELATLLTGRTLDLEVFPLNFEEFLGFNNLSIKNKLDLLSNEEKIRTLLREYMEFGGFPEVVLDSDIRIKLNLLRKYFDDIITKDVVKRHNIRKSSILERLGRFYIGNFASKITFNSCAKFLKMSEKTVENYSKYLEMAKLLFFIRRFSFSMKEQEKAPRKLYSISTGFANVVGFNFSENIGRIMENLVAVELLRKRSENPLIEAYYWSDYSGKEVDFVVREGRKQSQLIQVCYTLKEYAVKERETDSLIKASKELNCNDLLIITWDYEAEEKIKGKKIKFIPLWKWLLIKD